MVIVKVVAKSLLVDDFPLFECIVFMVIHIKDDTSQQMNRRVNSLLQPSFANSPMLYHYQLLVQGSELHPVQN